MNGPTVAYYVLVWCDGFGCNYPKIQFVRYDECLRIAETVINIFQATAWCLPQGV